MVENDLITFEELKTSFKSLFDREFNIHLFLSTFLSNGIMIFQMYYYSDLPDLQEKYYGFFMGYIVYKLCQLFTSYYQSTYSGKIQDYYIERNYLEMNVSYKKGLFMSVIIHIITYFPMKWIVMFIFTNTYLKHEYLFKKTKSGICWRQHSQGWGIYHYSFLGGVMRVFN